MQPVTTRLNSSQAVAHYLDDVTETNQRQALGSVVSEILRSGHRLTRKTLCTKLLGRIDKASTRQEHELYQQLLGQLF